MQWIDMAKGMSIVAVALGHIDYDGHPHPLLPLSDIAGWSWHVGVFFCLSGFFLKEEQMEHFIPFMQKKLKQLWVPLLGYVLFATFTHNLWIRLGFYDMPYYQPLDAIKQIAKVLVGAGYDYLYPLWFVRTMLYAFIILAVVFTASRMAFSRYDNKKKEVIRFLFLLFLAVLTGTASCAFQIQIPELSKAITGVMLIYSGYIVKNKLCISFDNKFAFIASLLIAYHLTVVHGSVNLNANNYADIITLLACTWAYLYIIGFTCKKVTKLGFLSNLLSCCGRNSFHMMALHPLAFKFAAYALMFLGIGGGNSILQQQPECGSNIALIAYYLFMGVFIPLGIAALIHFAKHFIMKTRTK